MYQQNQLLNAQNKLIKQQNTLLNAQTKLQALSLINVPKLNIKFHNKKFIISIYYNGKLELNVYSPTLYFFTKSPKSSKPQVNAYLSLEQISNAVKEAIARNIINDLADKLKKDKDLADKLKKLTDKLKKNKENDGLFRPLPLKFKLNFQELLKPSYLLLPEKEVIFDTQDDIDDIKIKDINSGKFTGFILSLLLGIITFIGLIYLSTQKLGIVLDITKISDNNISNNILNWFASLVGMENNAEIGIAVLAVIILFVMLLVYILRVELKSRSNLRFANNQMKETEKYITYKMNCKKEMDRIDIHIADTINTLNNYQLLLNEKSGILKRILHFEGADVEKQGYTHSSLSQMKEAKDLILSVQDFIIQPISNGGKLSDNAIDSIHKANEKIKTVLSKLS